MRINNINFIMPFKSSGRIEVADKDFKKDSLRKLVNSWQYIDIVYSPKTGQFGIYEYDFENGKKGKVSKIFDGILQKALGDREFLQTFLDRGYDIEKINFNNHPAKDLFVKTEGE